MDSGANRTYMTTPTQITNKTISYTLDWPLEDWLIHKNPALSCIQTLKENSPEIRELLDLGSNLTWTTTIHNHLNVVKFTIMVQVPEDYATWHALKHSEKRLQLTINDQ